MDSLKADDNVSPGGDGDLLHDFDAETFEAGEFARKIGYQADLRADTDFALVRP